MKQRVKKIALWSLSSITALAIIGFFGSGNTQNNNSLEAGKSSSSSLQSTDAQAKPIIETRTIEETESIPYSSVNQNDSSLSSGVKTTTTQGRDGLRTITYDVTYENGVETSRQKVSESVTIEPIDEVIKVGIKSSNSGSSCSGGYINSDGNCIQSPSSNPAGATAKCRDGTYSKSQHRQGTCSHHGGVSQWL